MQEVETHSKRHENDLKDTIKLCVKNSTGTQKNQTFKLSDKVRTILHFGVHDKDFGLVENPPRTYELFVEDGRTTRQLDLNKRISEEHIPVGACVIITVPPTPQGC